MESWGIILIIVVVAILIFGYSVMFIKDLNNRDGMASMVGGTIVGGTIVGGKIIKHIVNNKRKSKK
jgi:hypothetical protein